jgi:hypothetical protein
MRQFIYAVVAEKIIIFHQITAATGANMRVEKMN